MRKDITNREDIFLLVSLFYEKIKINKDIGHFFHTNIKDWDSHINKITNFWESGLFFVSTYSGRPAKAHIKVDTENNNEIDEMSFGVWLNLWFETIDENFEGEIAERAKYNARKMATHLHLKIFSARQK
ncbi:group III truncated hemoglobin [Gillisia sp. CAL575]|uniref:group III truncated hemoglobin n=1 Tax=Gillisia sp. CAL575 TaxID=985255 RepID=UPI0003A91E4D|nr:group III truncated hemoglobin [Gillisia sp. CAL575]